MFGSEILEVAIGIVFIFLLLSVICTAVREGIDGWLKTRAAFLEQGIREMLHDKHAVGLARTFYNHPIIYGLYAGHYVPRPADKRPSALARGEGLPSYIPSRNFAVAILDIAARGPETQLGASNGTSPRLTLQAVREGVHNLENGPVQRMLLTAVDTAQGDLDRAVANIAAWYDSAMDRVSGAYKRSTQKILFITGLALAILLNVNPITIADYLYHSDAARTAIVAQAEAAVRDSSFVKASAVGTPQYRAARSALDSLRLPIGWNAVDFGIGTSNKTMTIAGREQQVVVHRGIWDYVLVPIMGWLITAFAATLGAPFWFDILNKVMVIRSTVKPHEKSPEESSEDRQSPKDRAKTDAGSIGEGAAAIGAGSGAPLLGAVAPSPTPSVLPARTPDDDIDGCDVELVGSGATTDDALPPARGGIES